MDLSPPLALGVKGCRAGSDCVRAAWRQHFSGVPACGHCPGLRHGSRRKVRFLTESACLPRSSVVRKTRRWKPACRMWRIPELPPPCSWAHERDLGARCIHPHPATANMSDDPCHQGRCTASVALLKGKGIGASPRDKGFGASSSIGWWQREQVPSNCHLPVPVRVTPLSKKGTRAKSAMASGNFQNLDVTHCTLGVG